MNAIISKLWDQSARIERVIFIPGAVSAGDSITEDLEEFFDEDWARVEKCLGKLPSWLNQDDVRTVELHEEICEWIISTGKLGYLVKFATPVMEVLGSSRRFSWGYYSTTWVYAETIEEAIDIGLDWVKERRAKEDSDAAKKGGA